MDRGIVVGSRIDTENGFSFNGAIDSEEVPKWLLYWDKIKYAGLSVNGSQLSGNQSDDVLFLESEGIFNTEFVDISTDELPPPQPGISVLGLAENQLHAASTIARLKLTEIQASNRHEIWAMGQSGGEQLFLPGDTEKDLLDIKLINSLPIPRSDTPFEDILEFKTKHNSELIRLRIALDTLREKIISSSDECRATDVAINEISLALTDIHKALNSRKVSTINETLSLYINNPSLGFWAPLSSLGSNYYELPLEIGIAAGLGIPTICKFIQRSVVGGSNLPNPQKEFTYAYEVIKQLS